MGVALITGASKGLGLALARSLAEDGWTLVVDARSGPDLLAAVASIPVGDVVAVPGDVTDPAHRAELIDTIAGLGRLDLLVNNASTLGPTPMPHLADHALDALRTTFEVNVIAPLALIQALLPTLRASHGAILDVTSDAAVEGYEGWGGYGSSKAALEQLSNVLAAEEPEVRVWWVDPGDMRTQMHQDAFPGEDISDRPEPETVIPALRHLLATRPASGRVRAAEVAELAEVAP
jgi:NAD(P)-dependent dehydrogenase (short-subunit alcohol dehydrogenase family)